MSGFVPLVETKEAISSWTIKGYYYYKFLFFNFAKKVRLVKHIILKFCLFPDFSHFLILLRKNKVHILRFHPFISFSCEPLLKMRFDSTEGKFKAHEINGFYWIKILSRHKRFSSLSRSSRPRCSVEKVFLKMLQNSKENTSIRASFFNKAAGLRPATLLKKETLAQVFSCKFCEIFNNTIFYRTSAVATSVCHVNGLSLKSP